MNTVQPRVTDLKLAKKVLLGMTVPKQYLVPKKSKRDPNGLVEIPEEYEEVDLGIVGRFVEEALRDAGYQISSNGIVDMPEFGVEVKTRRDNATSPLGIGSMSFDSIVTTDYKNSNVFKKCQRQLQITWSDAFLEITSVDFVDLTSPKIQNLLESAYNIAREKIVQQHLEEQQELLFGTSKAPERCRTYWGTSCGYFENTSKNRKTYLFRYTNSTLKKLVALSRNIKSKDTLLDYSD